MKVLKYIPHITELKTASVVKCILISEMLKCEKMCILELLKHGILCYFIWYFNPFWNEWNIFPIYRKGGKFSQSHTVNKCWRQNSNPYLFDYYVQTLHYAMLPLQLLPQIINKNSYQLTCLQKFIVRPIPSHSLGIISPVLKMRQTVPRKMEWLVQRHIIRKWQSQEWNPR